MGMLSSDTICYTAMFPLAVPQFCVFQVFLLLFPVFFPFFQAFFLLLKGYCRS